MLVGGSNVATPVASPSSRRMKKLAPPLAASFSSTAEIEQFFLQDPEVKDCFLIEVGALHHKAPALVITTHKSKADIALIATRLKSLSMENPVMEDIHAVFYYRKKFKPALTREDIRQKVQKWAKRQQPTHSLF